MTSPLNRFISQHDVWKPEGPRCGNTVPLEAGAALSPLSELVASGVRLRNAQRRWAAGDTSADTWEELKREGEEFDRLLAEAESDC